MQRACMPLLIGLMFDCGPCIEYSADPAKTVAKSTGFSPVLAPISNQSSGGDH